jgi:parallel beta-helix repeat protein
MKGKSEMKNKYLLTVLVLTFSLNIYTLVCASQDHVRQVLNTLSVSPKLIKADLVLEDFLAGRQTTRVIVNLSEATKFQHRVGHSQSSIFHQSHKGGDINDPVFRQELQVAVRQANELVINRLDPMKVRITNKFFYIFSFSAEVTIDGLKTLEALDEVSTISKDIIVHANLAQGIPLMNATTIRNTHNGLGVAIAICDTGIDTSHPMLGGGGSPIFNEKVIGGWNTGDNNGDPRPDPTTGDPHGTACAGIAAGELGNSGDYIGGVAHNAKLYALKITQEDGANASDIAEAWDWCVHHQNDDPDNPILIISTSFGHGYHTTTCDSESPLLTAAAANAVAAGMTLFVSSGNAGFCDGTGFPACISYVNAVGAVYDADIGSKTRCIDENSCISYYGRCENEDGIEIEHWVCDDTDAIADKVACWSNSASLLKLLAPSFNAYTTDIVGLGGYEVGNYTFDFGGTSAACPYAAGAAAILQSESLATNGYFLSPAQVRSILARTGHFITDPKATDITKPRINLQSAVASLIWYVDSSLASSGDGSSWDEAFNTIQEAVDMARNVDEIWIKKGIYIPSSDIMDEKAANTYGGFAGWETKRSQRDIGNNITTIDMSNSSIGVWADITIDGFTFINANTDYAIKINESNPTIQNCTFSGNSRGALYISGNSSPTISNCNFTENSAEFGGAIFIGLSSPKIANCTFSENDASNGGAIYNLASDTTITDCEFTKNTARGGGAICNNRRGTVSGTVIITNCNFSENKASSEGGAMYNFESEPTITNCIFLRNNALGKWGGAIRNWYTSSRLTIANCIFAENHAENGGAVSNENSSPTITNCTFTKNRADFRGGAISNFFGAHPKITNCILWEDIAPNNSEIHNSAHCRPIVSYCDIQTGYSGPGNIAVNPVFLDPGNDDFHIQGSSPCIDKGSNLALGLQLKDFEQDPRIFDGDGNGVAVVDMGADEFFKLTPNEAKAMPWIPLLLLDD